MGIDMSKAFDIIKRRQVLDVLLQARCAGSERKFVCSCLANTRLHVGVNSKMSASFKTTAGFPQGGCPSPVLYNYVLYLATVLRSVQEHPARLRHPLTSNTGMPLKMGYAEDVGFLEGDRSLLNILRVMVERSWCNPLLQKLKDYLFVDECRLNPRVSRREVGNRQQQWLHRSRESGEKAKSWALFFAPLQTQSSCILSSFAFHSL